MNVHQRGIDSILHDKRKENANWVTRKTLFYLFNNGKI